MVVLSSCEYGTRTDISQDVDKPLEHEENSQEFKRLNSKETKPAEQPKDPVATATGYVKKGPRDRRRLPPANSLGATIQPHARPASDSGTLLALSRKECVGRR